MSRLLSLAALVLVQTSVLAQALCRD